MHLNGNQGATQIIAYVVSGVLPGRRRHMKQGRNVWGLNTAATVWCSAAVGACAGADLAFEAILLTSFVLAGNTRPVRWSTPSTARRSTKAAHSPLLCSAICGCELARAARPF
jgi:putative Mg2+ transporter-C (MgtC) family protein